MPKKINTEKIYIPKRIYEELRGIYEGKVTVIAAPDGSGKSTFLSEFVVRSRKDGISCRFIRSSSTAEEAFALLSGIILGEKRYIPISSEEESALVKEFAQTALPKDTIIIIDCEGAEQLMGSLRFARLAENGIPARLVLTVRSLNTAQQDICGKFGFGIIAADKLLLTLDEAREYALLCGADPKTAETLYPVSGGNIMKLRFALALYANGKRIPENGSRVLTEYMDTCFSIEEKGAIMAAASFPYLPDDYIEELAGLDIMRKVFGEDTFTRETILDLIDGVHRRTGMISLNRRNGRLSCHPLLFKNILDEFYGAPPAVQKPFRTALAHQFLRNGNTYYACVQFALAGDYAAAAACPSTTRVSMSLLLRSRDTILRIVDAAPMDCKPFFGRYLRFVALLMLTDKRELVKDRFYLAEKYISAARDYAPAQRLEMLSYIHTLRTYEDFFRIEKMGTHIKRAYELHRGRTANDAPFYAWNLYTPSVFSLIHRYSMPIAAESEQFLRYQKMYTEMIEHGEHICELYSAETLYYVGDLKNAAEQAYAGLCGCTEEKNKPTRIAFLLLCSKIALFSGEYHTFASMAKELGGLLHNEGMNELGTMAAMCLAELSSYWHEAEDTVFFLRCMSDEEILVNRYLAPFVYLTIAVMDMQKNDYSSVLGNADKYLAAADDVRSETVKIKMLLVFAAAALNSGQENTAAMWAERAAEKLARTDITAPAAEIFVMFPELAEFAEQTLPARYSLYIGKSAELAASHRRGIEAVMTYRIAATKRIAPKSFVTKESIMLMTAQMDAERKRLSLSKREFACAVLAASRFSNAEAARIMGASEDSIKSCLKRAFAKLGLRSRGQLKSIVPSIDR